MALREPVLHLQPMSHELGQYFTPDGGTNLHLRSEEINFP